jgi:(E)-2-((N-methylformamido)methylene)succinate hydrolase
MRHGTRLVVLAAIAVILLAVRGLTPPRPSATGAFGHGPTIVLVHGLGSRAEHWLPVARTLARHHRVVLVDLPGHGASELPAPLTLERAREALDLALAHAAPGPCVLVGHSLGGLVAAAEALEHPERLRGLVLVETALKPQMSPTEGAALLAGLDRDYAGTLGPIYRSFGRDSAQGEALYREVAALDPGMIKAWVRIAVSADLSPRAGRLTVPVLVALSDRSWPEAEPWTTTAAALGYAGVPRLEAARFTGAGHFVMLDQPGVLARRIERFADHPGADVVAGR